MKKKKINTTTVLLVLICFFGISLLLYPSLSNYWNSLHQTRAIVSYVQQVAEMADDDYSGYIEAANEYNSQIRQRSNIFVLSEGEREKYESLLNISGYGDIGYIEIPDIEVMLPIYHGTSERVLQSAVGHLDWTSLPVGGESTHCVLSGHRGLPSAKLFTHLDKLECGDIFIIRVLDEILTYEVDQILIVYPQETSELQIVEGEDYCTLVTCTPYGVNTQRLLVRGHRIENIEEVEVLRVTADAIEIEPLIVAPVIAVPMLLILLIVVSIFDSATSRKHSKKIGKRRELDFERYYRY